MKELTIQEKAERYDKSFERASNIHKDAVEMENSMITKTCEVIFPELAELDDEKIRKEIIDYIDKATGCKRWIAWLEKQSNTDETINRDEFAQGVLRGAAINLITWIDYNSAEGNMCLSNMECEDIEDALVHADWDKIYAYLKKKLEKQGEKLQDKSAVEAIKEEKVDNANKVEPKFKVGDWVMLDRPVLITKVEDMPYNTHQYWTSDGTWFGDATKAKLWTIQDAKDGDVLATDSGRPFIFKECLDERHANNPVAYCGIDVMNKFCISSGNNWWTDRNVHPATKEQHDLLFTKMKTVGYKLDENFNVVKI